MISKILIHKVASYQSAATLQTDKKVNVVYGLNGSGKSTITNFLYDTDSVEYQNCSFEKAGDVSLYVYNQRFIDENFYEADSLKGIFSLSKENKDIENKIRLLQKQLAEQLAIEERETKAAKEEKAESDKKRSTACTVTWNIKQIYTGGDRVLENFLSGLKGNKETLFSHLAAMPKPEQPIRDINQIKYDVEFLEGGSAQPQTPFTMLEHNTHDIETDSVFQQVIVGNTNSSVATMIEKLQNSDWVKNGLTYLHLPDEDEKSPCPFCQSNTITKVLASEIKSYFDESYSTAVNRICSLHTRYVGALENLCKIEMYKSNPFAVELLSSLTENRAILVKSLESNIRAIEAKKSSPSSIVSLKCTRIAIDDFNHILKIINKKIQQHNLKLENLESELETLKNEFWCLMRWEYDQTLSAFDAELADSKRKLAKCSSHEKAASEAIKAAKKEIALLQRSTVNIEEAVGNINEGLLQIGISDFSIAKHDEALYKIVRLTNSTAEFSSLSEGEKMIISFLYFCELCKGKRSASEVSGKKIAIIDDPVSSLSHIFVFNIGRLIKSDFFESKTFEQVFVLTHSLYFFYELADSNHKKRKETQKLFRIFKNAEGSRILPMKYEEVQNDYHSYWSIVADSTQPPALIANCMRNIVEYFFNFVEKQDLSNVMQRQELQENKYQAFCRYINRESHSLGQNIFDYKEFDYESFREGLRLVFEGTGYIEHYNKMISVMGQK